MMDAIKFYKYTIAGLLLLNIAVLAFLIFSKPKHETRPPRQENDFQAEIVRMLDLNSQQTSKFKTLADEHSIKLKDIHDQQQKLLPTYFETLTTNSDQTSDENVLNQYQILEGQKMEITYQHFQDIKRLLSEDQLPQFKEFMQKIMTRITGRGDRRPSGPGNNKRNPPPPGIDKRNPPPPRRG